MFFFYLKKMKFSFNLTINFKIKSQQLFEIKSEIKRDAISTKNFPFLQTFPDF